MDKLANEDETHHITPEEISVYRNNWWIRSNFVGSDTMLVRHRADFEEALTTLRRLKNQDDQAYYQNWQSSSSSWWNWQDSWWHSSSEYHRDDVPRTDQSGKPARISESSIYSWNESQHYLMQNYSENSVTANAFHLKRVHLHYRLMATKTVYLQHEQQHER